MDVGLISLEVLPDKVEVLGLGLAGDTNLQQRRKGRTRISGRLAGVNQGGRRELGRGSGSLHNSGMQHMTFVPATVSTMDGGKRNGDDIALFDGGMDIDRVEKGVDFSGAGDLVISAGVAL